MDDIGPYSSLSKAISQLDDATHTARHNGFDVGGLDVIGLVLHDPLGQIIVNKIEASAHTAAAARILHLYEFNSSQGLQESSRLLENLHSPPEVTRIVVGKTDLFLLRP